MADVLRVTPDCEIPLDELEWKFTASGGPGGQHANKTATRVEVRFDIAASPSLTEEQRERLVEKVGGTARVVVDDARSQTRNRALALDRLRSRLEAALHVPKARRPTRKSRGAQERRLQAKREQSERKASRRRPKLDE